MSRFVLKLKELGNSTARLVGLLLGGSVLLNCGTITKPVVARGLPETWRVPRAKNRIDGHVLVRVVS